jgi:hypothetical protein
VNAPAGVSLLEFTDEWARGSPLGDLRQGKVDPNDIEVRAWGGFGFGTTATIIRRREGRWRAWHAQVVQCTITVPPAVSDTASEKSMASFRAMARKNCNTSLGNTHGGTLINADSLILAPLDVSAKAIEDAWNDAVHAGLLELPPKVKRKWNRVDGVSYVIEVRQGPNYSASVIEDVDPPEVPADAQVKRVFRAIDRLAKTAPGS